MGQMTFGIMYGCDYEVNGGEDDEDDTMYYAASDFKGPLPGGVAFDGGAELIGLWVAVGASGKRGAADFGDTAMPFTLDGLRAAYTEETAKAERAWPDFAAFVKEKTGRDLGPPQFWLTSTEVA